MRIAVTGASGFLGSRVVHSCLTAGHDVTMLVRPTSSIPKTIAPADVELLKGDLRNRFDDAIIEGLSDVDCLIHLAAAKQGDLYSQLASTVVGTENLLAAMEEAGVVRLVGVSSFSVYDFSDPNLTQITELSDLIDPKKNKDPYAVSKLLQERLFADFINTAGRTGVIVRPGYVFGPNDLWHPLLGSKLGPIFLRVGSGATMPLTFVDNTADALVRAAERSADPEVATSVVNVVDDDLPTQGEYVKELDQHESNPDRVVTMPWGLWSKASKVTESVNNFAFRGQARFPSIFVPSRLNSRFRPLSYSNKRAKELLDWKPAYSWKRGIAQSINRQSNSRQEGV